MEREMRAAYVATRSHLKRAATAQKKYYDRSSHLYKYKEGDIVKLRRFRKEPGTGKNADCNVNAVRSSRIHFDLGQFA